MANGGFFRPRPLSGHEALDRLILALEVPDCECVIRVQWVQVPLGTVLSLSGEPRAVRVRLPRFGWQAEGMHRPIFGEACPHARKADHSFDYDKWQRFLALAAQVRGDADGYAEPPLDPLPWQPDGLADAAEALYRDGRVGLLAERARLHFALFHPGDWHQGNVEGVAIAAGKGRLQGGLIFEQGYEEDDDAEAELEALADLWAMAKATRPGGRR